MSIPEAMQQINPARLLGTPSPCSPIARAVRDDRDNLVLGLAKLVDLIGTEQLRLVVIPRARVTVLVTTC